MIGGGIRAEAAFFGVSVLVGACLFLLYDGFRIFRRIVPHGTVWTGVEDFVYWLLCTAAVFVMLYRENDGMVRGFAIGGVVAGMALYFVLFSRFVIGVNVFLLRKILGVAGRILGTFFTPAARRGKKILLFFRKRLKKMAKAVKMGLCKL